MLKLYYAVGACSLSPHIALREALLPFELERVEFGAGKRTSSGKTLLEITPKGYVPVLLLDDGQILTEGAAMVQYIADLRPDTELAPRAGSLERVRLQEWLNFIATELHKGLGPLYSRLASDEYKAWLSGRIEARLAFLGDSLVGKSYLLGDRFTVADGYAFYALRAWQRLSKRPLPDALAPYHDRILARPAVQAALDVEGPRS